MGSDLERNRSPRDGSDIVSLPGTLVRRVATTPWARMLKVRQVGNLEVDVEGAISGADVDVDAEDEDEAELEEGAPLL